MDAFMASNQSTSLDKGYSDSLAVMANDMYDGADGYVATTSDGTMHFDKGYEKGSLIAGIIKSSGLAGEWEGDTKNGIEDGWYTLKVRTSPDEALIEDYEKLLAIKK
jgi:hypothetical protein